MSFKDHNKYETLSEIFNEAKQRIAEHKITLRELSETTDIPEQLLTIFFDQNNEVVNDLSRLLVFLRFRLYRRILQFSTYSITKKERYYIVTRRLVPSCTAYYYKATREFKHFHVTTLNASVSKPIKKVIMQEMKDRVEEFINNLDEEE